MAAFVPLKFYAIFLADEVAMSARYSRVIYAAVKVWLAILFDD
jgi:hypothetical protein